MHYVGIDVASSRPSDIVVLDRRRECVETGQCEDPQEYARYLKDKYNQAIVAVDAPRAPAKALMANEKYRRNLEPPPRPGKYKTGRVVEWEVMRRGISIYLVPPEPPCWMQTGFKWFDALIGEGFADYALKQETGRRCVIEYYPYASFVALLGGKPAKKTIGEGRKQRVELLRAIGVDCDYGVMTVDMIDALVGAVTAWQFHRNKAAHYGDPEEGLLTVAAKLPDKARPLDQRE
jgi:predicted nuclease with RNAse H fold